MEDLFKHIKAHRGIIAQGISESFEKGGGHPVGTIKVWSGEKFIKMADGTWKYQGKAEGGEKQVVRKKEEDTPYLEWARNMRYPVWLYFYKVKDGSEWGFDTSQRKLSEKELRENNLRRSDVVRVSNFEALKNVARQRGVIDHSQSKKEPKKEEVSGSGEDSKSKVTRETLIHLAISKNLPEMVKYLESIPEEEFEASKDAIIVDLGLKKTDESSNQTSVVDTSKWPTNPTKDQQRIMDIATRAKWDANKMYQLASNMAKAIDHKDKAEARWNAAKMILGEGHEVAEVFKNRFKELGGVPGKSNSRTIGTKYKGTYPQDWLTKNMDGGSFVRTPLESAMDVDSEEYKSYIDKAISNYNKELTDKESFPYQIVFPSHESAHLFMDEMIGQISDGKYENTPGMWEQNGGYGKYGRSSGVLRFPIRVEPGLSQARIEERRTGKDLPYPSWRGQAPSFKDLIWLFDKSEAYGDKEKIRGEVRAVFSKIPTQSIFHIMKQIDPIFGKKGVSNG